jgi:hypothetical protein
VNRLILTAAAALMVLLGPGASAANFSFTGTQANVVWGAGFQVDTGDSNSTTFAINSALNLLPGAGLTFVNVGDIQTALLGTVQSNENPGFASGVVNGETDTLSMQIAVILGGQTFTFNLLSPDLGVSATGSIVASTATNNIVFTSGSSYSTVQQILSDGINYYTIGAIIQWSDN